MPSSGAFSQAGCESCAGSAWKRKADAAVTAMPYTVRISIVRRSPRKRGGSSSPAARARLSPLATAGNACPNATSNDRVNSRKRTTGPCDPEDDSVASGEATSPASGGSASERAAQSTIATRTETAEPRPSDRAVDVGRIAQPGPRPREAEQADRAEAGEVLPGQILLPAHDRHKQRQRHGRDVVSEDDADEAGEQQALEQLRGRRAGRGSRAERETRPADQPARDEQSPPFDVERPARQSEQHRRQHEPRRRSHRRPNRPRPAMKNTAMPTSGSASAAALDADANFSSVVETRTMGTVFRVRWRIEGIGLRSAPQASASQYRGSSAPGHHDRACRSRILADCPVARFLRREFPC